jgi:hypothetical protein
MTGSLKHALILAGLMVASTAAYAQTFTAKIDFPFRAGSTAYPAAEYKVKVNILRGAAPVVAFTNLDTKASGMVMSFPTDSYVKPGESKLFFQCHQATGCALAQIRSPQGSAWSFPVRKATPAELEQAAVVSVPLRLAMAGN